MGEHLLERMTKLPLSEQMGKLDWAKVQSFPLDREKLPKHASSCEGLDIKVVTVNLF